MRAIIQRVSEASVSVDQRITGTIQHGLLVLLGIEENDRSEDVEWLAAKIVSMRIFNDAAMLMNLSVKEVGGQILLVSQFTLYASTKKGNRPSFIRAAKPAVAIPLYNSMIDCLERMMNEKIQRGIFGADMKVTLTNDGPVTIFVDSRSRE